jgi:hypothetical protein
MGNYFEKPAEEGAVKLNVENILGKSLTDFSLVNIDSNLNEKIEGFCDESFMNIKNIYCTKIIMKDLTTRNYYEDYQSCLDYINNIAGNKELLQEIKRVGYYESEDKVVYAEIKLFDYELYKTTIDIYIKKTNIAITSSIDFNNRVNTVEQIVERVGYLMESGDDNVSVLVEKIRHEFLTYNKCLINNSYYLEGDDFHMNIKMETV